MSKAVLTIIFGTAMILYMALHLFKKYFCTENLLLNLYNVVIIHSKAFYCLGPVNKVNT